MARFPNRTSRSFGFHFDGPGIPDRQIRITSGMPKYTFPNATGSQNCLRNVARTLVSAGHSTHTGQALSGDKVTHRLIPVVRAHRGVCLVAGDEGRDESPDHRYSQWVTLSEDKACPVCCVSPKQAKVPAPRDSVVPIGPARPPTHCGQSGISRWAGLGVVAPVKFMRIPCFGSRMTIGRASIVWPGTSRKSYFLSRTLRIMKICSVA
jgi:hypothetical protein